MTTLFGKAWEKYLRAVVVYYKAADSLLYYSKVSTTFSSPVPKDDLINLFQKGTLVVDDGTNKIRPTTLTVSTDYAAVSHTTVGASDKAVTTTYYSNGYTG